MSDPIDRIVKGAPPPDVSAEQLAASARATGPANSSSITAPVPPSSSWGQNNHSNDPRDALPSSPPQIYLNLLILESSLRLQYVSLRARLRLHLLLLVTLVVWVLSFTYLLFFRPREDGSGVGGSVYWVLESAEKLGWCSGIVTLALFWGTGMYERGVRWPRKFVSTTNRGLRGFNLKVVVVKGSLLSELAGWFAMLDQMGWFREDRVNYQVMPKDIEVGGHKTENWNAHAGKHGLLEDDIAPGGDVLRVLLLPKPFSPDFREGWDTFRLDYWERENSRRSQLRTLIRARKREVARKDGGWLWWTGWRGWRNVRLSIFTSRKSRRQLDLDKLALKDRPSSERLKERRRKESLIRDGSHSRNPSLSRTPTPDPGDAHHPWEQRPRRGSSTSGRRPRKTLGTLNEKSRLSATETLLHDTIEVSPLSKRASMISTTGSEIDDGNDAKGKHTPLFANEIKAEPEDE